MLDFYLTPALIYVVFDCLAILGVGLQAAHMVFHLQLHGWKGRPVEALLELAVLAQLGVLAYLLGMVAYNASSNMLVSIGLPGLRYLLFGLQAALGAAAGILRRKPACLFAAGIVFFTLPLWEGSGVFVPLYTGAVFLLCIRAVVCIWLLRRAITHNLSALSVKDAMDSLPTGILLFESGGYIVFINRSMQRLMKILLQRQVGNGAEFYDLLRWGKTTNGIYKHSHKGSFVYELPDMDVWQFSICEIEGRKKRYNQLCAVNITEEWRLVEELIHKRLRLKEQKEHLIRMQENLEQIQYQEEVEKKRNRIHDILGQRMAVLQKVLRSGTPDVAAVAYSIHSMEEELRQDDLAARPSFAQIARSFWSIGVKLTLSGRLPDGELGQLALDMIRECATNAVRHGFAAKVDACCESINGGWRLSVTNDGERPAHMTEGGGIGEMRRRVEAQGGTLHIETEPAFTVTALIREGDENDQNIDC